MGNYSFRSDIQGLRAIAVIAVILYHFEIPIVKGGFVGVDIFFVISGYIISKTIIQKVEEKSFNFRDFYFSRIKRLYPALLATIFTVYLGGLVFLSPIDLKELSTTSIFASIGVSNIYFWLTSGYFDNFASLKPLLHTWSLGVEFQFYLIWPFFIFLIYKLNRFQFTIILIITIISGIVSYKFLKLNATGAFFLMPFRIHEFSIGTLTFLIERKGFGRKTINNGLYILGAVLIFIAIFKFNSGKLSFPGKVVWIPLCGTALMIYAGSTLYFDKIINNKLLIHIGEISYSLYLTHWPIFVFYKYITPESIIDYKTITCLLLLTIIFSHLLYRFIEKPFRLNNYSKLLYISVCQTSVICITTISFCSYIGKGWEWRLPQNLRIANSINIDEMHNYTWSNQIPYAKLKNFSDNGKEKILIIGDSQAADLINLLAANGNDKKFDIVARTIHHECSIPYIDIAKRQTYFTKVNPNTIADPNSISRCHRQLNSIVKNQHLLRQADRIFVSFIWYDYTAPYIDEALNKLDELSGGHKLWLFGNKTLSEGGINIYNSYNRMKFLHSSINHYAVKFKLDHSQTYKLLNLNNRKNTKFVDMYNLICKNELECYALTPNGHVVMYDTGHFSPEGAKFLGNNFYEMIKN